MTPIPIHKRIRSGSPLLLDGATGTELQRRGFDTNSRAWSAAAIREAPDLLQQIHREYVAAGADIITANTFRTHARSLQQTPWHNSAKALTCEAVALARQAAAETTYIAGSIAPLEDCYSPDLTPSRKELEREHAQMVQHLVESSVDLILIETQITIREAVVIARLCAEAQIPYLLSFTCGRDGQLLSGESLADAVHKVLPLHPTALLVNCIPVEEVQERLAVIKSAGQRNTSTAPVPIGAYANTGRLMSDGSWESTAGEIPAVYAEFAVSWKEFGIQLIGGCCGTTPVHIESIYNRLYEKSSTSQCSSKRV